MTGITERSRGSIINCFAEVTILTRTYNCERQRPFRSIPQPQIELTYFIAERMH